MSKIVIRACHPNDIEEILQLDRHWEQENIAHNFIFISREEFIACLERFPEYFLIAESGGHIVGYINGSVQTGKKVAVIPEQESYLEIDNIYVKPEFRNKGIGGKLMKRLLETAAQNGIQRFFVSSDSKEMDKVLNFYRGYGFKLWYIQMFK